jgi:hypothetical protein
MEGRVLMSARSLKFSPLTLLLLVLVAIVVVVVGGWAFKVITLVLEVVFWTIIALILGYSAWKVWRRR